MATTAKAVTTLEIGEPGSKFQIPISLKKITTSGDVEMDTASDLGNPMGQVYVDLVTKKIVPRDKSQKGVFRKKPNKKERAKWSDFKAISKEALETIEAATQIEAFTIEHFIPLAAVPKERITDAYFIAPAQGASAKPLVMLTRSLKRRKVAGVLKIVKSSRQHLAVVYEKDGGLLLNTLAFAQDFGAVREAAEELSVQRVEISKAEQSQTDTLVELLTSDPSVLDSFADDLIPLRSSLVERALAGKALPKPKPKIALVESGDDLEARLRLTLAEMQKKSPPMRQAGVAA